MGIIQKQAIKGSIYSYLGVVLGFINTALLMPLLLLPEEIGLANILVALSSIYAQFSTLGFGKVTTRLFPYFRNINKNHNGFVFIVIIVGLVGFTLAFISFIILKPYLIENNTEKSPLLVEYIWFLIPLIFFKCFFLLLDNYNKVLYDATTGTFLKEIAYRFFNLIFLLAYFLELITFPQYMLGYIFALCFPTVYLAILLIYRRHLNLKPQLQYVKKSLRNEMVSVAAFGIIGGVGSIALQSIDKIIVNSFLDLKQTGIYSICFFFGTLIKIPNRALAKISSTILADAWKNKDLKVINNIYYQSSINQLIAGCLLFILLIANLHNIFHLLPEYIDGKMVIFYISLGNLIFVSPGVSSNILGTSVKYKTATYQLGILIIVTIITNIIFIPIWGINGAAIASLISMSIITFIQVLYLKTRMNLYPYKKKHILLIVISVIILMTNYLVPKIPNWIVDFLVRSSLIFFIYVAGIFAFKISEDFNKLLAKLFKTSIN